MIIDQKWGLEIAIWTNESTSRQSFRRRRSSLRLDGKLISVWSLSLGTIGVGNGRLLVTLLEVEISGLANRFLAWMTRVKLPGIAIEILVLYPAVKPGSLSQTSNRTFQGLKIDALQTL